MTSYGGTFFGAEVKAKAGSSYEEVMKKYAFFNLSVPRVINYSRGIDSGLFLYTMDNASGSLSHSDRFMDDFRPFGYHATLQSRYAISRIKTSNQSLDFYYDAYKGLEFIELRDSKNNKIRNFYFDQSYVGNYQSQEHTDRTNYLDAIRIAEAVGLKKTISYSFEYESKHPFANYTKGGNYWGGLNSRTVDMMSSVKTSVPPFVIYTRCYQSNHYSSYIDDFTLPLGGDASGSILSWNEPSLSYSLAGQLKKITYPTGGSTEFEFGMNYGYYAGEPSRTFAAGGLRINEIRNLDSDGTLKSKKVYEYGEYGGGIPNGFHHYSRETMFYPFSYKQEVEYIVNPKFDYDRMSYDQRDILETKTTYLSSFMESMNFNDGSPVYYEKVTEYDYSASGENGKKEFFYTSPTKFGYPPHRKVENMNMLRFDEDWRKGKLEREDTYRSTGNGQYSLINSVTYEYDDKEHSRISFSDTPFKRRIYMAVYTDPFRRQYTNTELIDPLKMKYVGNGIELRSYMIYTGAVYPVKKTEINYDGGKESTTVTQYAYDSFFQPTETTVTYPDGRTERETISYANQLGSSPFAKAMQARNQIGVPIEIARNGSTGNIEGVVRHFRTENPAQVSKIYAASSGGGYHLKATFDYDAQNNLSTATPNDGPSTVYLWGYDRQYPVAEIQNSDYATVCAALSESVIATLQSSFNNDYIRARIGELRNHPSMKNALVRTFIHTPLIGVTEITEANGTKVSYYYDNLGRLVRKTNPEGFSTSYYQYHYTN